MGAICGLWKNLQVLIYSKLHIQEKSGDYVLIKYMKKYEIPYRAEEKRKHQVQK